jgi:tetratricopeptide (TPR) repeat protein
MAVEAENPVVALCVLGTQAEYAGRLAQARDLYRQAWEAARDDYDAYVAAHYMARLQDDPKQALHWNEIALLRAEALGDEHMSSFYPSLYVNLGRSHELLGNLEQAQNYYRLASELGLDHETGDEKRVYSI